MDFTEVRRLATQMDWRLVVAVCAFLFAVFAFWWNGRKTRKALTYDFEFRRLRGLENVSKRLVLTFEGQPVSDVSLLTIQIRNSGRSSILASDFDKTPEIRLDAEKLLSVNLAYTKPVGLDPVLIWNASTPLIKLDPLLLNAGDELTIYALVTRFTNLTLHGRIVGVRQIKMVKGGISGLPPLVRLSLALIFGVLIAIVTPSNITPKLAPPWMGLLAAAVSYFVFGRPFYEYDKVEH